MAGKKKENAATPHKWEDVPEIPKEEQPYPLPVGWKWVKLGELTQIIGGGTPSTAKNEYFENGDIPWITPADLSEFTDIYISHGKRNITKAGLENSSARLIPKDSVCLTTRAPIGYVCIADNDLCTNQGFKSFLPTKSYLSSYLYWYLKGNKEFLDTFASGTTFLEISGTRAKEIPLPLPPLETQHRIVSNIESLFSKLDEAAEKVQTVIDSHEARKQAILHKAFSGELTRGVEIKEDELYKDIPEIPKQDQPYPLPYGWKWVKIKDLYQLNPKVKADDTITASFVPMSKISSGMTGNFTYEIKPWGKIKKGFTQFEDGDIAFAKISPCFENGKRMLVQNLENGIGAGTTELIILRNKNVSQKFSLYLISTDRFIKNGTKTYSGTVGQQRINMDYVRNYPLPLPPRNLQDIITSLVDKLISQIENALNMSSNILNKIDVIKKTILNLSFYGIIFK